MTAAGSKSAAGFSGLLQKTAIRRLYEALQDGSPRLGMQALLEEIESRARRISQVFSGADPRWREIVGYGKGHVWLKVDVGRHDKLTPHVASHGNVTEGLVSRQRRIVHGVHRGDPRIAEWPPRA